MSDTQPQAPQEALPPSFLNHDDLPPSFLSADDLAPGNTPAGPAAPPAPAGQPGIVSRVASDIGHGIVEAPGQALRGVEQGFNGLSGSAFDAAKWLNEHVVDLGQVTYDRHGSANPFNWSLGYTGGMPAANAGLIPDAAMPGPATSTTGGLVEGATQFATGMALAGKFLRPFGFGAAVTGAAASGASMALAFDPHEQRLSDLVQSYPALQNPLTEFLASYPDDGPAMARFRAGLEGLGIGAATEGVMAGVRALKSHYAGDTAAAIEHVDPTAKTIKIGADGVPELTVHPDGVEAPGKPAEGANGEPAPAPSGDAAKAAETPAEQAELPLEGGGTTPGSAKATMEENPGATVNGNAGNLEAPAPQAKKLIEQSPADLAESLRQRDVNQAYRGDEPVSGIRTDLIENGDDIKAIMDGLRTAHRDAMDRAVGGSTDGGAAGVGPVRTLAEVRADQTRIADIIGDNPQVLMQRMSNMHGNLMHLDAETRVYGDFLATVGDKVYRLAKAVDDPLGRDLAGHANRGELMVNFAKHYELMANVQAQYRGIQTNVARTLNAFKIGAKINPDLIASIANPDDLFAGGVANMEKLARRINSGGGDLANVAKATRPGLIARFLNANNEYWINSVLSGPKTHIVNMIGNTMSAALLPAERMIAGALKVGTPAGRNEFLEGGLHYVGMAMSLRDAVMLSAKALKLGEGVLDASHNPTAELGSPAISSGAFGMQTGTLSGVIMDGLGATIRLPSRFLTAEDEFFKQLVYRGAVRAQALREGFQSGAWNDAAHPTAMGDLISRRLDEAAGETSPGTNQAALAMAKYATFQNDLAAQTNSGAKTIGESLNGLSNAHPLIKMILPFVRTPTNMMRYMWDRTPGFNVLRGQFRNDVMGSNGAPAQAQAMAKMATGGALWATALTYVSDGSITGGGPSDPNSKKALMATGWQPYSFKQQQADGSVSYSAYDRLDPFGGFFGLAADFGEVAVQHPEKTIEDTAVSLVAALAKNLENKTYVSGLVRSLAALGDPDKKGSGFVKGLIGGYVPSFLKQTMLNDDTMREARTLVDGMRARTPGYSTQLDPQRNILGAEVHQAPTWGPDWMSPIAETSHPGGAQPVSYDWRNTVQARPEDELARLMYNHGSAITPPPTKIGQLDMTQLRSAVTGKTAYDRMQELTGTVEVGGMTLRDRIADTVKQSYYRNTLTDGDTNDSGSRITAMQKWVGAYRKAGQEALGKEQPEIGEAIQNEMRRKGMTKFAQPQ